MTAVPSARHSPGFPHSSMPNPPPGRWDLPMLGPSWFTSFPPGNTFGFEAWNKHKWGLGHSSHQQPAPSLPCASLSVRDRKEGLLPPGLYLYLLLLPSGRNKPGLPGSGTCAPLCSLAQQRPHKANPSHPLEPAGQARGPDISWLFLLAAEINNQSKEDRNGERGRGDL